MKLKDLKPNECIVINSRKEAKQLRKLLHKNNITAYYSKGKLDIDICIGMYVYIIDSGFSINDDYDAEIIYTIKDFIPKKSKFKKDVNQELVRLDNLTNDLSIRLSAFELYNFVKVDNTLTPETLKAITEPVIKIDSYKPDLWYKSETNKCLFLINYSNGIDFIGYGFDTEGNYHNSMIIVEDKCILATHEEIETALIEEAKMRGFKAGIRFKSLVSEDEYILNGNVKYFTCNNSLIATTGCIFYNGKWAEIVRY